MNGVKGVILPLVLAVIGLILTTVVATQAAAAKIALSTNGFAGAASLMDIVPLVWVAGVITLAGYLTYRNFRGGM